MLGPHKLFLSRLHRQYFTYLVCFKHDRIAVYTLYDVFQIGFFDVKVSLISVPTSVVVTLKHLLTFQFQIGHSSIRIFSIVPTSAVATLSR